jgi:exopolyphosphatase/guanosine-5'-triphosphate,3'-diphosphate pyrophosphatase
LIADEIDGRLRDGHREMRIVRLGQGVDATGQFAPDALARTKVALVDYAELLRSFEVPKARMVATSAARDAANRDVFFAMTADVLGAVVPGAVAEVITGIEEAALSFHGAVGELDPASAPFVVVDLGGGSTEVVLGERDVFGLFATSGASTIERCPAFSPLATAMDRRGGTVRDGPGKRCGWCRRAARTWVNWRHDDPLWAGAEDDDLRPRRDPPVQGWIR